MLNGILAVWKVLISHSPWKWSPAWPPANIATAPG